jgi:hypothetical protein
MTLMQRIQFFCKPWKPWLSTLVLIGGFSLQVDSIKNQLPSNIVPWIAWGVVVLMLIMAILDWIDNRLFSTVEQLKKDIEIEKDKIGEIANVSREVFRDHLKTVYESLGLQHNERLSLFIHDEANNCFVLVGRFSLHTKYCKWGRGFYKEDQGVINEIWKEEHYNYFLDKDKAKRSIQNIQKFNMDQHTLDNLQMDTVGFWGKRLSDINSKPIAVILMEASERSQQVKTNSKPEKDKFFERYKNIVNNNNQKILNSLELFKPFFPSPNTATKEGF